MQMPTYPSANRCLKSPGLLLFTLALGVQSLASGQSVPGFAFPFDSSDLPASFSPLSLAVDPAGHLFISSLSTLVEVASNGTYLATWGTNGTGPGEFAYPGPMVFDSLTNLYVSDSYNNRIEKWDATGKFLKSWGTFGTGPGQFDYPEGVAVDNAGRVYVADSNNNRVQVFTSQGGILREMGSAGTNAGQFSGPWVLATDSSNNLYVVDLPAGYLNCRIQKFDVNGTFLTQWSLVGSNSQNLVQITAIATDPGNNVYVVDGANNRVQKFTSDGAFLGQWGAFGSGPGQFNDPSGIALDPSGNYVYVSDYYNRRIEVFAYAGLAPIIYLQPTNRTIAAGTTLSLSARAFGAEPLSYQWTLNGTNLPGATSQTLMLSNAPLTASGPYAVVVTNPLGAATSATSTVTILPVVVTTLPVSSITSTSAVLKGSIVSGSIISSAWFEWGTDASYGTTVGATNVDPNVEVTVTQLLTNLSGLDTYHYRLVASNTLGLVHGEDVSFQVGLKPTVTTLETGLSNSNAVVVRALVNPNGRDTQWYFRWGSSSIFYGTRTGNADAGDGVTPVAVQAEISGLNPGVIYHAQAVATNALGVGLSADIPFIAPPLQLVSTLPTLWWSNIAVSADGTELAVSGSGSLLVSTNSGANWTSNRLSGVPWEALAMSADGGRILALTSSDVLEHRGLTYVSTNHGASWTLGSGTTHKWLALASSADTSRLAGAADAEHEILTSTNGGLTWVTNSPPVTAHWCTVACSADGQQLIAAAGALDLTNGPLFTSTNAGLSWSSNSLPLDFWRSVASSADGHTLFAAIGGWRHTGPIYTSSDSGLTWALTGAPVTNWGNICVSADGTRLVAVLPQARVLFLSTNSAVTWTELQVSEASWPAVACSADGARFWAAGSQDIFILDRPLQPGLMIGNNQSQVELSWIIPSSPFSLHQTHDLRQGLWTPLTNNPVLDFNHLRYRYTEPISGAGTFYRLQGP